MRDETELTRVETRELPSTLSVHVHARCAQFLILSVWDVLDLKMPLSEEVILIRAQRMASN